MKNNQRLERTFGKKKKRRKAISP